MIAKDFKDYIERVDLGTDKDKIYGSFYLRRSPFTVHYSRKYQKFDDLLSFLGGFISIVVAGIGICI